MNFSLGGTASRRGWAQPLAVVGAFAIIALVYWPVRQAGFVWDDKILVHDTGWLRAGGPWLQVVLHGIPDWNYFRPLGLAFMVAEVRWLGVSAGPMHLVSLLLHLVNVALVGLLAWRLRLQPGSDAKSRVLVCAAMLAYGLHPTLIEPVAWIASQFDLLVVLFMLTGLLLNLALRRTWVRALLVALSFFIAACTKETAIAFPVLLVLLDWRTSDEATGAAQGSGAFGEMVRRQAPVYLAVFAAGIAYLIVRHWALSGQSASPTYEAFLTWERLQTVSYIYMMFWRMIVWPFVGISPDHVVPAGRFALTSAASLATDLAALAVGLSGLVLAWRRRRVGIAIVGVTAILFPVLHVIPLAFDESLYHERYAAPAIAWICALLPGMLAAVAIPAAQARIVPKALIASAASWLLLALLTVCTTVPLWANDTKVWQWAMRTNPDSIFVMNNLMSAYITQGDLAKASGIADELMSKARSCPNCMMNVASLAVQAGDGKRASEALQLAGTVLHRTRATHALAVNYELLDGSVHQMQHDYAGAEAAYRYAISIDPQQSNGYLMLSLLLARQGKAVEARNVFDAARPLLAPDLVERRSREFADAMALGAASPIRD